MDETKLGRPARHARRARPSGQTRRMAAAPEGARRRCSCGAEVDIPAPESLPAGVRRIAEAQLAGELPTVCEGCIEREAREEREAEEREAAELAFERRRRAARMPAKWAAQGFEALDADGPRARAIDLARQWAAGAIDGLVLYGPVGRGKTAIAAAAANGMLRRRAVRWLPVSELLLDLRMPFDSAEYRRATRQLDAARGRAALVLDDLDKLRPTEHAVQPLYVAVNGWIEAGLPLLVTLNRDLDALVDWMPDTFGEAIGSRLAGYCKMREVGGRDRRVEP